MKLRITPTMWLSFAMIAGVMGTALISPLYPLYKDTWQLQTSDISFIYVMYMAGAMIGLLFFGRLSDRIGFKPIMLAGLILVVIGTVISMLANDLFMLCFGRVIVGIASTMVTTSATVGMTRLAAPEHAQRAAVMSGFLLAIGFGLGPFIGGLMGQWSPFPLTMTYIPPLVAGTIAIVALFKQKWPQSGQAVSNKKFRFKDVLPKLTLPERHDAMAFTLTSFLPFLAFGVFGLYASLSPLFLDELLPWHGPIVSGVAIASILLVSAITQIMGKRALIHLSGFFGLVSLAISNALLIINLLYPSSILFGLGVLFTAFGHGLCMLAGMSMISRLATTENRSGLLSSFLVIGYFGSIVPMTVVGWIADHWGMNIALYTFCTFVITLSIGTAVMFNKHPRMQPKRA
jgi:MFS family permease